MKRLTTKEMTNAGLTEVRLDPEVFEEMLKNTYSALRKFSSSRKTKAVHKILDNKLPAPTLFTGNAAEYLVAPVMKGNILRQIKFNLFFFDDSLDRNGAVGLATRLENIDAQIQKEKTYLSDKQVFNLEQLNKDKKEISDKFLKSLDYVKLVDGLYFGWLIALSYSTMDNPSSLKPKIVTTTSDIMSDILKKMYQKVNSKVEPEVFQLLDAISVYFIRIYYYGETAQYALNLMQGTYNEEVLNTIKKARVTQFKEFNDLSVLLKETQLLPLTKNTFDLQMQKMFGKYGYDNYIQLSLADFTAFMANLAHPTSLFKDAYELDDESHLRLEELLLNQAKSIKMDKVEV